MSEYVVPTVGEISEESDRTVLSTIRSNVTEYGKTLTGDVANIEILSELKGVLDAVDARFTVLDEQDATAAAEAAAAQSKLEELAAQFSTPEVVVEIPVEKPARELRVPLMSREDKEELSLSTEDETEVAPEFRVTNKRGEVITDPVEFAAQLLKLHANEYRVRGQVPGSEKVTGFSSTVGTNVTVSLTNDEFQNMKILRDLAVPAAEAMGFGSDDSALVASGGYCAPSQLTSYEIPSYSELCSTLESVLPSVNAPRGTIKFIRPGADTTAAGIAVITCDEDKAGYDCEVPAGTTPCKPTAKISCPTTDECCVDMITKSLTIGNLNARTFPELINWALKEQAVNFNRVKQQYLLDKLNDPSNVTVMTENVTRYGALTDFITDLIGIAAAYRGQYKRCYGSNNLIALIPKHFVDLFKIALFSHEEGLNWMNFGEADVRSALSTIGYNAFFYEGKATGTPGAALPATVVAGVAPKLPANGSVFIFEPGDFVILRNGTLDLGIVRDYDLNHANNMEMFSEEFIGLCRTGKKAVRYDVDLTLCSSFAGSVGCKTY